MTPILSSRGRRRLRTLLAASTLLLGLWLPAHAQPSGAPLGPQPVRYEIPANTSRVLHVSPDAKAAASGESIANPTTLEDAIARATSGDVIVLRGGTYRSGSLVTNQGITLQAYADEQPIIKGSRVASEWTKQKNGLWRTHWDRLFPSKPAEWWNRPSVGAKTPPHRFNNDMVFVDGRRLRSAGWEGELDQNSFYIDYEKGNVYLAIDPTDHLVEITAHDGALTRSSAAINGRMPDKRGPRLLGLTFTQYAYRAIEIEALEPEKLADESTYGDDVTDTLLENVTITHCSRVAAYLRGRRTVVRNCFVSDTSTEGLYLLAACDSLLERNIIARNNVDDIQGYFPAAVKIFNQSHRVVCRDNLVIDQPHSMGIWYDVGNCDAVFINNWLEGCQFGFFFEISKRALCAGNVFVNCDAGVKSLNSSGVEIYFNTFINSPAAIERNERSAVGDHFGWHPSTGPDVHERVDHVLVGNVFAGDAGSGKVLVDLEQASKLNDKLSTPQLARMDSNVYIVRGGEKKTLINYAPATGDLKSEALSSLEALRAKVPGFEASGVLLRSGNRASFRNWEHKQLEPLEAVACLFPAVKLPEATETRLRSLLKRPGQSALLPGAYQTPAK